VPPGARVAATDARARNSTNAPSGGVLNGVVTLLGPPGSDRPRTFDEIKVTDRQIRRLPLPTSYTVLDLTQAEIDDDLHPLTHAECSVRSIRHSSQDDHSVIEIARIA